MRIQRCCLALPYNVDQEIEKLGAMHGQLLDLLGIGRRHRYHVGAVVELAKGDPDLAAPAGDARHGGANAELVQELGRVDANADAGADLAVLRRLLVHVNCDGFGPAVLVDEEGGAKTADAAAYDGHF